MERARVAGRLWDIDTGHDLMIIEPDAVADVLLEIAEDVTAYVRLPDRKAATSPVLRVGLFSGHGVRLPPDLRVVSL
jgi:hypothetical protein